MGKLNVIFWVVWKDTNKNVSKKIRKSSSSLEARKNFKEAIDILNILEKLQEIEKMNGLLKKKAKRIKKKLKNLNYKKNRKFSFFF